VVGQFLKWIFPMSVRSMVSRWEAIPQEMLPATLACRRGDGASEILVIRTYHLWFIQLSVYNFASSSRPLMLFVAPRFFALSSYSTSILCLVNSAVLYFPQNGQANRHMRTCVIRVPPTSMRGIGSATATTVSLLRVIRWSIELMIIRK
jgi:hypothetical protein